MKTLLRIGTAAIILIASLSSSSAKEMNDMDIAVLRTIDKVSAYTHTFEIPVGKTVKFGSSLFIKVRACRKAPPIETPEDSVFLQIWERKPDTEKPSWVFSGWMFSSNPSVSGVEHPVYDVWIIECKNERTSRSDESFSEEAPEESAKKGEEVKASPETATPSPTQEETSEILEDD